MKSLRSKAVAGKYDVFHVSKLTYEVPSDTFLCPAGQQLAKRCYN